VLAVVMVSSARADRAAVSLGARRDPDSGPHKVKGRESYGSTTRT
jgi:hypothetical protein